MVINVIEARTDKVLYSISNDDESIDKEMEYLKSSGWLRVVLVDGVNKYLYCYK